MPTARTRISSRGVGRVTADGMPAALASKLDGVCTADDPLVQEMLNSFREAAPDSDEPPAPSRLGRIDFTSDAAAALESVIAVGASLTSIPNPLAPQKVVGYIKVATVRLDLRDVAQLTSPVVNPESVGRLLRTNSHTQSAVVPMGSVRVPGRTLLQTLRHVLHATLEKFEGGALYDTLDYLVSCGWDDNAEPWRAGSKARPHFLCPFCEAHVSFPRRRRQFACRACGVVLTLVDYLGLLTDATEATSDSTVAMNLKGVLEHLTVLTLLRRLAAQEHGAAAAPGAAGRVLLLKDGPLMLRGQCTRLVEPIRAYLRHLHASGARFHLAGVDREGAFVNHCNALEPWLKAEGEGAVFVPENKYVLERIKHAGGAAAVYGKRGLYGSKAFCRVDDRTTLVLSVPNRKHGFDTFAHDPEAPDLVGLARAATTLRALVSRHFPTTPLPLVAVDRLCDLPQHPLDGLAGGLEQLTASRE